MHAPTSGSPSDDEASAHRQRAPEALVTLVVGSANLSLPALLTQENVEAVVERQLPAAAVAELLRVPGIQWRPAQRTDRCSVSFATGGPAARNLGAAAITPSVATNIGERRHTSLVAARGVYR